VINLSPLFPITQQQILLALDQIEKARKTQSEQAKTIYDQTKSYQTTIIGLAYGGFFAIWAYAKTFVTDTKLAAVAGALMGLSIFLFVVFEILNMLFLTFVTLETAKFARSITAPSDPNRIPMIAEQLVNSANTFKEKLESAAGKLIFVWPWFFIPSLLAGIIAALLLIYLLLKHALVG
jgi:hypothetical protein